ncbi:MAG: class IIb bacteriocin, lactobin A/cerein 7B family [Firmicutes bacterium]|nr:class IIb bacteriocin, lactobin A/cerein 7B family [Bacillota bacterium]
MHELSKKELKKISGGISAWGIAGIILGIIFGIGVVDGIVRPLECN